MGIINYQIGNMAHVEVSALSKQQKDELVCTYAALMLHDGELEISEDKLKKVITASGNAVEGYWPGLFAKALKGKNIADMLASAVSASAAPVAASASAAPAKEEKKAEKKKKKSPRKTSIWEIFSDTEHTSFVFQI